MLSRLNELTISERVMVRQLRSYRKPQEGLRLPRIYRNIDEASRPLVPLWYNATTSRTAYEEKNPRKREIGNSASSHVTAEQLRAQSLPAKFIMRDSNYSGKHKSSLRVRFSENASRYVITTAPVNR